jgi:hypothetical protein
MRKSQRKGSFVIHKRRREHLAWKLRRSHVLGRIWRRILQFIKLRRTILPILRRIRFSLIVGLPLLIAAGPVGGPQFLGPVGGETAGPVGI